MAPLASRQIGRAHGLEHEPLGAGVSGLLAQGLQLLPVRERQPLRQAQESGCGSLGRHRQLLDQGLQGGAALAQGPGAPVMALPLEQVVSHERCRALGQQLAARAFAAQAPLQLRKASRPGAAGVPDDHLAIEHGAIGQSRCGIDQLWKGVMEQLFTAAPEKTLALTANQLAADAIPFPLDQPVLDGAAQGRPLSSTRIDLEWRGQIKRIRAAGHSGERIGWCQQGLPGLGGGAEAAHQPVLQHGVLDPAELRQRLDHQPFGHADAQPTGEQLVGHQQLLGAEPLPEAAHGCGLLLKIRSGCRLRQQHFHPVMEWLRAQ